MVRPGRAWGGGHPADEHGALAAPAGGTPGRGGPPPTRRQGPRPARSRGGAGRGAHMQSASSRARRPPRSRSRRRQRRLPPPTAARARRRCANWRRRRRAAGRRRGGRGPRRGARQQRREAAAARVCSRLPCSAVVHTGLRNPARPALRHGGLLVGGGRCTCPGGADGAAPAAPGPR